MRSHKTLNELKQLRHYQCENVIIIISSYISARYNIYSLTVPVNESYNSKSDSINRERS